MKKISIDVNSEKSLGNNQKRKRCPKGTRKNKQGICE